MADISFTDEEIEKLRIQHIKYDLHNQRENGFPIYSTEKEMVAYAAPKTSVAEGLYQFLNKTEHEVTKMILNHPTILTNSEYFRLATHASMALFNLRHALATVHLPGSNQKQEG